MKLTIAKDELQFGHKETLNKDFWQDEKLNPEVRAAIIAVIKNFLDSTSLDLSVDDFDEIEFTGSLANYNYGKFSDIDIHLLLDFSKISDDPEFLKEYLTTKAIMWNNQHNVTLFGHEAELYITDAGSDHHSTGVYSIKNNEWIVKPVRDTKLSAELNLNKVKDKADKISKEIDMLATIEGDTPLDKIKNLKNKIKKMRQAGLESGGEFSIENLAFKLLRRRGELSFLRTLMAQAADAELSLDEDVEWWKRNREDDNRKYRELMGYVKGKGVFKRKYAAKNIGYPKSGNRVKISKSGSPYTVDPPSKLPMSGPPGVGALEEETDLNEATVPPKFIKAFKEISKATMKFQVLKVVKGSLGPFKGTAFKPGKNYDGFIVGDNITFPNTEAMTGAKQVRTKDEFLEDLKDTPGEICQIIKCDTSTITAGGKSLTFNEFIAGLDSVKPAVPIQPKKKPPVATAKDKGVKQVLGSGPVPDNVIGRILENVILSREAGDVVKIYFRDIYENIAGKKDPCLKKHSYTAKLDAANNVYDVAFDGKNWDEITHPENKFADPAGCRFFNNYNNKLKVLPMYNWLLGQLKQGTIYKIELLSKVRDNVTYVGNEYVAPVKPYVPQKEVDYEGPFFKKINQIKNKTSMLISLHPKETLFAVTDMGRIVSDRTINYVYYTPREKPYMALLKKDNTTALDREVPGKERLLKFLKKQAGSLDIGPIQGAALGRLIPAIVNKVAGGKRIRSFKRDEYLKDLQAATNGKFCESFDCKKSKIKFKKGQTAISIENWLSGTKGKTEAEIYAMFIKKLNKDYPKKSYEKDQIRLSIDDKTTGLVTLEGGIIARDGLVRAIRAANRIEKAALKIESGAEQPTKTRESWAKLLQNEYRSKCYELNPADEEAHIGAGNVMKNNDLNNLKKTASLEGIRVPKISQDFTVTIICVGGETKKITFKPSQLNGDIFNTGYAIKVNDKSNNWLEENGGRIGFAKVPNVKNGWFMQDEIEKRWKGFGAAEGASTEIKPGVITGEQDLLSEPDIEKYFFFSQLGDVNKKTFNDQTTPQLRDQLVILAKLAQAEFGKDAKIEITEAYKAPKSGTHVAGSLHYQKKAVDFVIKGQTWETTAAFTLAQMANGKLSPGGFGLYFKKGEKELSDKPHYDVRGRDSTWKWVNGKKQKQFSKYSRRSKKEIVNKNLFKLPDAFLDKVKGYM
jgi:hypothetical protein